MKKYLSCIKSHRGTNVPDCRNISKAYLTCRMDRYVQIIPFFRSFSGCLASHTAPQLSLSMAQATASPDRKQGRAIDLVIPTCQSDSDRALGTFESGWEIVLSKGVLAFPSFRRSNSRPETLSSPVTGEAVRWASSLPSFVAIWPMSFSALYLSPHSQRLNTHFLLSHCFGRIRTHYHFLK